MKHITLFLGLTLVSNLIFSQNSECLIPVTLRTGTHIVLGMSDIRYVLPSDQMAVIVRSGDRVEVSESVDSLVTLASGELVTFTDAKDGRTKAIAKHFVNQIRERQGSKAVIVTWSTQLTFDCTDTYSDISTRFSVCTSQGIEDGGPVVLERFADTISQTGHGFSVMDPVFINSSGDFALASVSNEDSIHVGIVSEVINSNEFIVTYAGAIELTGHGYIPGQAYFVQQDGSYSDTVEDGMINDIAFIVINEDRLFITEQRPVMPSVDLNGVYSGGTDTIPSGTISAASNWLVTGEDRPNYYFTFNSENDVIAIRGDSVLMTLGADGLIVTDYRTTKKGVQNAANGYVTNPESLATKRYVDDAVGAISTDIVIAADSGTPVVQDTVKVVGGYGISSSISSSNISVVADTLENPTLKTGNLSIAVNRSLTMAINKALTLNGSTSQNSGSFFQRLGYDPFFDGYGYSFEYSTSAGSINTFIGEDSGNDFYVSESISEGGFSTNKTLRSNGTLSMTGSTATKNATIAIKNNIINGSKFGTYLYGIDGQEFDVATGGEYEWNVNGVARLVLNTSRLISSVPIQLNNWTTAGRPASPLTGDIGWNTTNANLDLYNGSAWVNYAQHSSGTGLGTSTRIPYYDANGRLTDFSGLTFNGSNTLSFNGTGSTIFNIGPNSNFYYDAVNTGAQMTYRYSGTSAMTFPISGSAGFILNPSAANLSTTAGLLLSTGRTIVNEAAIRIMTTQNVTAGSGHYAGININNTLTPDAINNVSGSSIGGINIEQTYNTSSGTANQAMEYIGVRIVPTLSRNTISADAGYGVLISPTLTGIGANNWYGIYNSSSTGYFLTDVAGASNYLQGNTRIGYSLGTTNYKLHVTKNTGNYPMAVFAPAIVKMQIKGTTTETPFSSFNNYTNFPSLSVIGSANSSTYEMTSMASGNSNRISLFVGGQPISTGSASQYSILAHTSMQATPDASITAHTYGVAGVSEYILQTAEDADTDLSGATYNYYAVAGLSKLSQAWSNGTQNFYSGYFDANGVNTSGGTNGTNMYGVWTSATGGTAGSWALYSDEGHNWLEDETRIGGTWSTPTANLDIDGSQRLRAVSTPGSVEDGEMWTSSTQKAITSNQAGINQVLQGVIFTGTADASTSNTNTETTITPTGVGSLTLPANFFVAGKTIKVTVMGTYGTDAVTAPTLQLKLKLGSTEAVAFSANTIPTKTSNGLWVAEYNLTCRTTGASGTFAGYGEVELNDSETTRDATWKKSSSPTIDTTVSQAITITATFGTADTDNTITTTVFTVEILN